MAKLDKSDEEFIQFASESIEKLIHGLFWFNKRKLRSKVRLIYEAGHDIGQTRKQEKNDKTKIT